MRGRNEMDVGEKLIAVVGPNEAGKTSFLKALSSHLDNEGGFSPSEVTRGMDDPEPGVWARFVLDEADREALAAHVPEAMDVKQLIVEKGFGGSIQAEFDATVKRDHRERERALKKVQQAQKSNWLRDNEDESNSLGAALVSVVEFLEGDAELQDEEIEALRNLANRVRGQELPKSLSKLPDDLEKAATAEEMAHPEQRAQRLLLGRKPRFLFFDEQARELRTSYPFEEGSNTALDNLLSLAGSNWGEVTTAADPGHLEGVTEEINRKLDTAFEAWGQSELTVRIRVSDQVVSVLVRMATVPDYVGIEDRSDGLRQFVALRAFIAVEGAVKPILLIDEAEAHLHYDAQADLVEVLIEQEEAPTVIYSTHSAGCLPRDLGRGVRVITPKLETQDEEARMTDDSEIVNDFWAAAGHGFSPLLVAMGASAFAFASTRLALIAEGISDAILLPSLIRAATGSVELDYQVVPGLSNVKRSDVDDLDLAASRVVYVVDGDKSGHERREMLTKRAGIPKERVLIMGGTTKGLVVEDMIDGETYRAAQNAELRAWQGDVEVPSSAIPKVGRPSAVEEWCKKTGVQFPSKRAVAVGVLRLADGGHPLVDSGRRQALRNLHKSLTKLFAKPSHL